MNRSIKRAGVLMLALCLLVTPVQALGVTEAQVDAVVTETAAYIQTAVADPTVSATGGEWAVLGLARSGERVPESWYDRYYRNLEAHVERVGGTLSNSRYTDYARVTLALTAMGKDPRDVAGYDLLAPLADYDKVIAQGVNGPIFALLALDSGGYAVPEAPAGAVQATRAMYVQAILDFQGDDGGFSLTGGAGDPDVTGMALQALAKYRSTAGVPAAIDRAIAYLSGIQNGDGGFSSWGEDNLESSAQVLVALCELGLGPEDSRLVKNGNTVADSLLDYYLGGGTFSHIPGGEASLMATEQGLYALVALQRFTSGQTSLYDMSDAAGTAPDPDPEPGVFADVPETHWAHDDIAYLVEWGVVNGVTDTTFAPDRPIGRAEFVKMLAEMSGDPLPAPGTRFTDVPATSWYAPYIYWGVEAGVITGRSETEAAPGEEITRQEMAVMIRRYTDYTGLTLPETEAERVFPDDGDIAAYAREAVYAMQRAGIISGRDTGEFDPRGSATRAEAAKMLAGVLRLEQAR